MAAKKKPTPKKNSWQQPSLSASRLGFAFIAIYGLTNGIYQAWKLLAPEVIRERWLITIGLFALNIVLWQLGRRPGLAGIYYRTILWLQALMYVALSAYSIYSERGMASNSIILFVIPIAIIALERRRSSLALVTVLSCATYGATAIKYFFNYPSEGYKVELYGGIVFYVGVLMVISYLLWLLGKSKATK